MTNIQVGQEAPDFTLVDETGEEVTLSSFKGETVVLIFYPFDFSPPCTSEMCTIRDDFSGWDTSGAKVFGISRDSKFCHAAFKEAQNLPISLLADTKGEVAKKYDVWNETAGFAERGTFIIDGDGKVTYTVHNPAPEIRDHSVVEEYLRG